MKDRKHFSVYFNIHERLKRKQNHFKSMRPKGSFGIAVDNDEFAVKYQSIAVRFYIVDCYMRNNIPQKHVIDLEIECYSRNNKSFMNKPIDTKG